MDLSLTESQEMLRPPRARFVEREAPRHAIVAAPARRVEPGARRCGARPPRLGWLGHPRAGRVRGQREQRSPTRRCCTRSWGAARCPGPFFSSGVLGALTVLEAATEAQRRAILPAGGARRDGAGGRDHRAERLVGPAGRHAPARSGSATATGSTARSSS